MALGLPPLFRQTRYSPWSLSIQKQALNYETPPPPARRGMRGFFNAVSPPLGVMAAVSPIVGFAGFPLLPHWLLDALEYDLDGFGQILMFLWPGITTTFCVAAFVRAWYAPSRLCFVFAAVGLIIQILWIMVTVVLVALFSQL